MMSPQLYAVICEALIQARHLHPDDYNSPHEGLGFVSEEYEELKETIFKKQGLDRQISETLDLICTSVRTLEMLYRKRVEKLQ